MTPVHRLHGVAVASALPLSRRPGRSTGDAELEIAVGAPRAVGADPPPGALVASLRLAGETLYSAVEGGDGYVLRVHGLCDFETTDLGRVVCRPAPDAEVETLALVARGAFLAFWLGLRGACVLHASAVDWDGRGVVFAGHSGAGKSTMAAWACRAGARFACDDLLRLGDGPQPTWVGCSPELRLRPGAGELATGMEAGWASATSVDGRLAMSPPPPAGDTGPVTAVVLPRPDREAATLSLEQLDPVEAVVALAAFPRLGWRAGRALESQFDGVSRLASAVPVFVAGVPWGPPFRPEVVEELLGTVTGAGARAEVAS
ncbi:MAG: hypothetical protein KGJ77_01175 [Acidobacteriota bacterium]|nr:hypothetical protein [Acidobacteriota bacterium]